MVTIEYVLTVLAISLVPMTIGLIMYIRVQEYNKRGYNYDN